MYSPSGSRRRWPATCYFLLLATYYLLAVYCSLLTTYHLQAAMTDMFKGTAIQMRTLDLIATTYGTGDPDPREPGKLCLPWLYLLRLYLRWLCLLWLCLLWPEPCESGQFL